MRVNVESSLGIVCNPEARTLSQRLIAFTQPQRDLEILLFQKPCACQVKPKSAVSGVAVVAPDSGRSTGQATLQLRRTAIEDAAGSLGVAI